MLTQHETKAIYPKTEIINQLNNGKTVNPPLIPMKYPKNKFKTEPPKSVYPKNDQIWTLSLQ